MSAIDGARMQKKRASNEPITFWLDIAIRGKAIAMSHSFEAPRASELTVRSDPAFTAGFPRRCDKEMHCLCRRKKRYEIPWPKMRP